MKNKMTSPKQLALPLNLFDTGPLTDSAFGFGFAIKRSPRRRYIELHVHNGKVSLMLPAFVSNAEGLAFVRQRRDWVMNHLLEQQKFISEAVPKAYQQGEVFKFKGRQYKLDIIVAPKPGVELINRKLVVKLSLRQLQNKTDSIKKLLWRWYQDQALEELTHKTLKLAKRWGLKVKTVQVRKTKSEWGHCTNRGLIQYNWVVMAAPQQVIDYLVAHEVAHLRHRDHSEEYWKLVEKMYPNYKPARNWLRDFGHTLTV